MWRRLRAASQTTMNDFFNQRDRWGNGRALWVLVAMAFLLPVALTLVRGIRLHNDVTNWLPRNDPSARTLAWYVDKFPVEDTVLMTWDSSSLTDERVEILAQNIRGEQGPDGAYHGGSPYAGGVKTPLDLLERLHRSKIEPDDAVRRLGGIIIGHGSLKVRLSETGRRSKRHTKKKLTALAEELGFELQIADRPQAPDFVLESDSPLGEDNSPSPAELIPDVPHHDWQLSWPGMRLQPEASQQLVERIERAESETGDALIADCFFVPRAPVALAITLSEAGTADRDEAIADFAARATDIGIPEDEHRFGGRPVAGEALNTAVKKAAVDREAPVWNLPRRSPIVFSMVAGCGLALLVLRSWRLTAMVMIVATYATLITVALVPASGGSMNMVLVVMPTLLLVLTISGAVHVANYWKHAVALNPTTAIPRSVQMAKMPCLLASLTTAVGLIALRVSPLKPVQDFGVYSAAGCVISLVCVLVGFPALMQYFRPVVTERAREGSNVWHRFGRVLARAHTFIVTFCIIFTVGCLIGLKDFRTETKVVRYFPEHARLIQDYLFIEDYLAGIIPVDTIVRFDKEYQNEKTFLERLEIVRTVENAVREHPEVSGTLSLASFLPVSELPPENASRFAQAMYHKRANTTEQRIRESGSTELARFLAVAEEAAGLHENDDELLNRAGDELWRITAHVSIMSDVGYGELSSDLDRRVQSVLKNHGGANHLVTGLVPVFLRTQEAVLESLISSFGLAFAIIAVVMMIVLRNPAAGLITMLPNLLPIAVVFGLISWSGLAVDIGTMITASVALGIAVDGTLHLLTWFRDGLRAGETRTEAICGALGHCGPAMFQTSAIVGFSLLTLYPVELLLVSRFGWLMAALIAAALVADVVFLPALLAGPLGSLIERSVALETPHTTTVAGEQSHAPHSTPNAERAEVPAGSPGNESGA